MASKIGVDPAVMLFEENSDVNAVRVAAAYVLQADEDRRAKEAKRRRLTAD